MEKILRVYVLICTFQRKIYDIFWILSLLKLKKKYQKKKILVFHLSLALLAITHLLLIFLVCKWMVMSNLNLIYYSSYTFD